MDTHERRPAATGGNGAFAAGRPFSASEAVIASALAGQRSFAAGLAASLPMPAGPVLSAASVPVAMPALRLGTQGDMVRAWQAFLTGQGLDPGGHDGGFGDKTMAATRAFQMREGLEPDGAAGRATLMRAMQLGFELIEEPASDASGSNFPPRPDFPPLTSTAARHALFGQFDFVPEPQPGSPERIRILGSWQHDNIAMVPVPQLRAALGPAAPSGMQFHRLAAEQLRDLWSDWEQAGLLGRILSFDGSFVPRFVRGSRTELSNHAFGNAFDINAGANGLGVRPKLVGERGSVRELVPIANRHGFFWGGHFGSRPDGMHFEVAVLQ